MVIVELVLDTDGNRGQEHGGVRVCVFQTSENSLTKLMFLGATAKNQQSFKGGGIEWRWLTFLCFAQCYCQNFKLCL